MDKKYQIIMEILDKDGKVVNVVSTLENAKNEQEAYKKAYAEASLYYEYYRIDKIISEESIRY